MSPLDAIILLLSYALYLIYPSFWLFDLTCRNPASPGCVYSRVLEDTLSQGSKGFFHVALGGKLVVIDETDLLVLPNHVGDAAIQGAEEGGGNLVSLARGSPHVGE